MGEALSYKMDDYPVVNPFGHGTLHVRNDNIILSEAFAALGLLWRMWQGQSLAGFGEKFWWDNATKYMPYVRCCVLVHHKVIIVNVQDES